MPDPRNHVSGACFSRAVIPSRADGEGPRDYSIDHAITLGDQQRKCEVLHFVQDDAHIPII
jgi:hypothetical protein